MKRDWELIRQILIMLEEKQGSSLLAPGEIEGYSVDEVSYHYRILMEAGLIRADYKGGLWWAVELTWQGHELLESMRERRFWNRVIEVIKNKGIVFTVKAIKAVANELIKKGVSQ